MRVFTESIVEEAALAWLDGLRYVVKYELTIAPGEFGAEQAEVLSQELAVA